MFRLKYLLRLCLLFSFISNVYSQDYKGVDEHALADTRIKGTMSEALPLMAVPASAKAINNLIKKNLDQGFLVFPVARETPIELLNTIPEIWTTYSAKARSVFQAKVARGEYFVFQLGLFAHKKALTGVSYQAKGLQGITCFNLEGRSSAGESFKKEVRIDKGAVQPLWFGMLIKEDAPHEVEGEIVLSSDDGEKQRIKILLTPSGNPIKNYGVDEDWRLSRLLWLNSAIEQNEEVTKGYLPIKWDNQKFSILGREVVLGKSGLPSQINSFFDSGNMHLNSISEPILSDEIKFEVETADGKLIELAFGKIKLIKQTPRRVIWEVKHHSSLVTLLIRGEASCEGAINYKMEICSEKGLKINDVRLKVPMTAEKSSYLMGMGKEGGIRPQEWRWKWDVEKSQDMVWVGGVNGGLALKLKGENYRKQLVNIYYPYGKLNLPLSWGNNNLGGCDVFSFNGGALIKAYSGQRSMNKGETLHFDFELLITPFKLLTTKALFTERYYHNSSSDLADSYLKEATNVGANMIVLHHKKDLNPFINYPYLTDNEPRLTNYVSQIHQSGKQVGLYYTTRELTVNAPEIWAFRSLNGEVIYPGPGKNVRTVVNPEGPHPWLINRFKENFIPAWKCALTQGKYAGNQDVAVITTPDSRLDNFYLEGLNWLCKKAQIDGIYLDGTTLGRDALRRARKILDKNRPSALIDMHIWNNFKEKGYYANGVNLYMDLFPFIDHLWIGEGRSYDTMPDYWLVEMSGIPFGLPSQMLNHGGNRWKGMVFGLTNRPGWYGPTPKHIWKFWDEHRFSEMQMFGFWNKEVPIRTDNCNLYATVYQSDKEVIIALANWGSESHLCKLYIDWDKLGLDPNKVKAVMPYIEEFQQAKKINLDEPLRVNANEGNLIVLSY